MGSTKKKISIHDYPEHLNPFSEPTEPSEKEKIFVDRLNKSGTWSSKITKRVNRSVTWIEKSWLGIEDSKKYKMQSDQTCKKYHEIAQNRITEKTPHSESASNSNGKHDCDYQQIREKISETIVNPNELSSTNCDQERKEITKKKKRPAPLPPNVNLSTCSAPNENTISQSVCLNTSSEKTEEMDTSSTDASVKDYSVSLSENEPLAVEESLLSCEFEEGSGDVDSRPNSRLSQSSVSISRSNRSLTNEDELKQLGLDDLERLDISNSLCENESREIEIKQRITTECSDSQDNKNKNEQNSDDATISNVEFKSKIDENANDICSSETRIEENQPTVVTESKTHCNGKAAQV